MSDSYAELLERDDLDAVYVPLPAAFRFEWTTRALERGLHVLAEKPIAMNAGQAREMVEGRSTRARPCGRLPLRVPSDVRSCPRAPRRRRVGEVEHLEVQFDGAVPSGPEAAIYLDPTLGGGVLLHQACYTLHAVRSLARAEPEVVRATAKIGDTGVDESIDVELVLPSGATARARSSMEDGKQLLMQATVRGSRAVMTLDNFIGPHYGSVDAFAGWTHLGHDRPRHAARRIVRR